MDCKDARKRIHEYIDGDAEYAQISAHIAACAECRAYYESLMQQKELLASLAPKNAPAFDLVAAKRRKKAKFPRAVAWASAAAAVLVVVLITGSMGLFSGAKSEAPAAAEEAPATEARADGVYNMYAADESGAEEAAPAEKEEAAAPAEEAPAPPEDLFIPDEQHAAEEAAPPEKEEAPAEEAPEAEAEEAPAEEEAAAPQATDIHAEFHTVTLSESQLADLINTLSKKGISPKSSGDEYVLAITEQNIDPLREILPQFSDVPLSAGTTVFIRKE